MEGVRRKADSYSDPSVREASGFPHHPPNPFSSVRQSPQSRGVGAGRKARGFPHGRRQSGTILRLARKAKGFRTEGGGAAQYSGWLGKPEASRTEGGGAAESPGWFGRPEAFRTEGGAPPLLATVNHRHLYRRLSNYSYRLRGRRPKSGSYSIPNNNFTSRVCGGKQASSLQL